MHIHNIHPLRAGLGDIFSRYRHVLVPEMNDSGVYGFGQLATLLRAKLCDPRIQSFNKTEGLGFRVIELVDEAEKVLAV